MTTALSIRPARAAGRPVAAPSSPRLAGVRLGHGPHLLPLLRAALVHNGAPVQDGGVAPAGYVMAVDAWSGSYAPPEVVESLAGLRSLDGRPVGLIAHGADVRDAVTSLQALGHCIREAGGLPVDGSLCLEPADVRCAESGSLADVTVFSQLALLGDRVQRLAASRLILRSASA